MKPRSFALLFAVVGLALWLGLLASHFLQAEAGDGWFASPITQSDSSVQEGSFPFPLDQPGNVDLLGQIGGAAYAVAVQGHYAYLGVGLRLAVLDVSDPVNPQVVGQTPPMPVRIQDVVVSGTYAYLADYDNGVRVVDVSNPVSPTEVGFYDTPGYSSHLAVSGSYAYVADGDRLLVLDISNPLNPTYAGSYGMCQCSNGLVVSGTFAYVAEHSQGLRILDISNPANPVEVGLASAATQNEGIAVYGNHAFLANSDGLRIIDIVNPVSPTEISLLRTPGPVNRVVVSGSYAYVSEGVILTPGGALGGGLRIIDVANPLSPQEVGYYGTPRQVEEVAVFGPFAYLANEWLGLRVIAVHDPANPVEAGAYDPLDSACAMAAANLVYVADCSLVSPGLSIIDASDPRNLKSVGFYPTPDMPTGIAISGTRAYIAAGRAGLRIIDVSDPRTPKEVGYNDTVGGSGGIVVSGGLAYVGGSGFQIIDVSGAGKPNRLGLYRASGSEGSGLAVSGHYVYLAANYSGLRIVDVSNPFSPTEVGYFDTPGEAKNVVVAGRYACVADGSAGLRIIDVSNPAEPSEVSYYDKSGYVFDVRVSGPYVYLAGKGLVVVDVFDPLHPREVGQSAIPLPDEHLAVLGDYAFAGSWYSGLAAFQFTGNTFTHKIFFPLVWSR